MAPGYRRIPPTSEMTMQIRPARTDEIGPVAELWMHTFPGERTLAERIAVLESGGIHGGIETVRVAVEEGRLAGALKTIPFTQYIRGTPMPMMGLAAVGVAPHARRRGVAAALCRDALVAARARGDVVSALYPFRPAFYRRLGWGLAGELHSYRFAPEALVEGGDPGVRLAEQGDLGGVRQCYGRVARGSNGLVERDAGLWERQLKPADAHVFVVGEPVTGYMIVRYDPGRLPSLRRLYVRELVTGDRDSYERLLNWIPRQRDLWRRVRYDAMPAECFGHRLADPRPPVYRPARWLWGETARILRGPMVRIVDVAGALEARTEWGGRTPFAFRLVVEDRDVPENEGSWRVGFDGGRVSVGRPAVPNAEAGRLQLDVATLSQLFVGELDVPSAVATCGARVEGDIRRVAELFGPAKGFRLLDEF